MKTGRILLLAVLINVFGVCINAHTVTVPETVIVHSGSLELRALLWRPKGKGPFPAVLFNHGRGLTPHTEGRVSAITELGSVFAKHGYVFIAPFRRGEDLSADQGVFIGDLLERERAKGGDEAAKKLQVRMLETDHLQDVLAGLAYLRRLPEVDVRRLAVVGHSFGGSLALLVAEHDRSLQAAVNFAGAAGSWDGSMALRKRLVAAVSRLRAPVLSVYAANDFSTAPGEIINAEMTRRSKEHRLKLFPSFGKTPYEGHQFVYRGISSWEHDVFAFLDEKMKRRVARRRSARIRAPASLVH